MNISYAAKIENGIVRQVIVGDSVWATENLGGFWVDSETKVGVGWAWTEQDGFVAPQEPEPEPEPVE